ncbi:MAG: amidohydrolase family protein [bacterium]|nr:amidohydrolase family protein [candidate division KSB1 bacterium]MDH7559250.1 amidohydrolase family protein [bacterium]
MALNRDQGSTNLSEQRQTIYFDCFAAIGRRAAKDPRAPWSTAALLAEMERCQVHGALVFAHQARETHPAVGNPLVTEECRRHPRLFPCWVGIPHHTGEFPPPEQLVRAMEAANVRALKIFPRLFEFRVDEATLGPLLSCLEEAGILLIVDAGRYDEAVQIDWQEVNWICSRFPRLNLLLHSVRWESTRTLVPLAQRHPNLYFEFSNYQGNRMLEFWCEVIGHERLLFGSEALVKSMGAARAYVDYAELTEAQRRAIASGNLQRLLRLPSLPPPYPTKPKQEDHVLQCALRGEAVRDSVVIDAHAHIVQAAGKGASRVAMNRADAQAVVERNRRLGVAKTCVSAWTAVWGDYVLGNQDTLQAMRAFPEEIVGYAVLDPNYVTDWERECRFYHLECRFLGMKPYYPRQKVPYNDPLFTPWYRFGDEHRLFCLLHYSDKFKEEVSDIAPRYPNIAFILAHSGTSWKVAREHVALAKQFPNVFLEITFTSVTNGVIEFMLEELGSERVLYGSDAPMRDPYPQFGWVAYADLPEEDKRNILGRNMQRILDRVAL